MGRPPPCVLFAQSFHHPRLAEYVDEVRFTEPVVISACEILELHTPSLCPTLSLSGVSSPQSFALEIFIRSGGEARFKRLCPGFLYSPSASNLLEVQAAVTDHLVIRGSYRALSLVVYGNPAKDLGQFNADHDIENTLSDLIIPFEGVCKPEDLPEALHLVKGKQSEQLLPLRCLRLIPEDPEQLSKCRRLISLVAGIVEAFPNSDVVGKISSVLLSVSSAFTSEDKIDNALSQFPLVGAVSSQKEGHLKPLLDSAIEQIDGIYESLQNDSTGNVKQPLPPTNEASMVEIVFHWLQSCFESLSETGSSMLLENAFEKNFMGCIAAVQLLCMDVQCCFRFVVNGGMRLLIDILQFSFTESSASVLILLEAMKFACRHAFACESLLGWWPLPESSVVGNSTPKTGYVIILKLLLQTKRFYVAHMAAQILQHLRVYELAASFQSLAEPLLENFAVAVADLKLQTGMEHALKKASIVLKQFVEVLSTKDHSYDQSPAQTTQWLILDGDDSASTLTLDATYNLIASSSYCVAIQDMNPHVLVALQERRLLPLLAAMLSASWMRSMVGHTSDLFLEFLGIVQSLLLTLISCRSGILFLASDLEAAAAIVSALGGVHDSKENDLVNCRHALSLTSRGFLCHPQDIAAILETSLSVINSIDQLLLATTKSSEDRLWALWELTVFSRTEAGRQALSAITFFPEVFLLVMEALQPESLIAQADTIEERGLKRAIIHSAAVLMHAILTDQSACTLAAWIPHAMSLQKNLLSCSPTNIDLAVGNAVGAGSKDTLCARLLDWVDAAVVYHKKGAVGLLRYAAAVVVGSANQLAAVGLPVSDSVEPDSNVGEGSGNTELPTVETLLGRGVTFGVSGTILSDTAVIQLTVSMRILASISCHPGVAAVLYGEGVMPILYLVLEYGAVFLQTSSHDYDYVVEEDGDGDGTMEILIEQARERLLLSLLLPTLLLLLSLLNRLQVTGEEYRNTRLVEILLCLHRGISARLVSRATIPAEAGGMLVLAAVSRVLVSVLACWPIYGWTPSLFVKLLGGDGKTVVGYAGPLEPKEASSVLRILGDMLPEEHPQLCTDRSAAINIYRSLAVQTLLGRKSMDVVGWHCQASASEKLVKLLVPHLDQIASMIFHLASTTCAVLHDLLKLLVIRFVCQSKDKASVLVWPFLSYLREHCVDGHCNSDVDDFRVERYIYFISELVKHPATKKVLLQEGLVSLLLQALNMKDCTLKVDSIKVLPLKNDDRSLVADGYAVSFGWATHVLSSFASICDPYVSLVPAASLTRRLVEDCPSFEDFCSIVTAFLGFCKFAVMGEEFQIAAEVVGKIGSHKMGRAAFASSALSIQPSLLKSSSQKTMTDLTNGTVTLDTKERSTSIVENANVPPFFLIWKRLAEAFDADKEEADGDTAHLVERFAFACIQLSGAGKSICGLGALQILSGFDAESLDQDLEDRKKEPLVRVLQCLKERCKADEDGEYGDPSVSLQTAYNKALKAVNVLLRLLRRSTNISQMEKRLKMVVDELSTFHSSREQDIGLNELPPYWSALPTYFSRIEEESDYSGRASMENALLSLKETLKEKFTWECSAVVPDRPCMAGASSKRKSGLIVDGTGKKHRIDGNSAEGAAMGGLIARTGSAASNSITSMGRRDNFRQRKPNTSRPPSMHVDDYIARERGNDAASSGSVMNQRSGSGGGRPPSIHVDEFMARQRERQLVVAALGTTDAPSLPQQSQQEAKHPSPSKSDSAANIVISRRMLTDDELHDVNIDIDGVPDADDLLSLPGADELLINNTEEGNLLAAGNKELPELSTATGKQRDITSDSMSATAVNGTLKTDDICKEVKNVDSESQSKSPQPQHIQLRHPSIERDEMKQQSVVVGVKGPHSMPLPSHGLDVHGSGTSLKQVREGPVASIGMTVQSSLGEQRPPVVSSSIPSRSPLQFATGPPLPSLPPPPPIPAGVVPQKYESFASPVMEQRHMASAGMPIPAFESPVNSGMNMGLGREMRAPLRPDYLRGGTDAVASSVLPLSLPRSPAPPLPPLPPPQSWPALEHPSHHMDTGQRSSSSAVVFCSAPSTHPLRPLVEPTLGAQMSHTPVPPWTANSRIAEELGTGGTGRPPPPLPPTPPPFSISQATHLQISPPNPTSMPPSSSPYPPIVGSLPLDNRPAYVLSSSIDASQNDKRVDSFASSIPIHPSPFIPPLPPGRPQSLLPLQQQQHIQVLPAPLQPPPPPGPPPLMQQHEQSHTVLQPHFQQQMKQPLQQPSHQHLQPAQQIQQQESGKLLQQILASPDAIQDLLKDQNKLQQLLEQHPKLISLLQEKMR